MGGADVQGRRFHAGLQPGIERIGAGGHEVPGMMVDGHQWPCDRHHSFQLFAGPVDSRAEVTAASNFGTSARGFDNAPVRRIEPRVAS
jgi:hypothetical protein